MLKTQLLQMRERKWPCGVVQAPTRAAPRSWKADPPPPGTPALARPRVTGGLGKACPHQPLEEQGEGGREDKLTLVSAAALVASPSSRAHPPLLWWTTCPCSGLSRTLISGMEAALRLPVRLPSPLMVLALNYLATNLSVVSGVGMTVILLRGLMSWVSWFFPLCVDVSADFLSCCSLGLADGVVWGRFFLVSTALHRTQSLQLNVTRLKSPRSRKVVLSFSFHRLVASSFSSIFRLDIWYCHFTSSLSLSLCHAWSASLAINLSWTCYCFVYTLLEFAFSLNYFCNKVLLLVPWFNRHCFFNCQSNCIFSLNTHSVTVASFFV